MRVVVRWRWSRRRASTGRKGSISRASGLVRRLGEDVHDPLGGSKQERRRIPLGLAAGCGEGKGGAGRSWTGVRAA